MVVRADEISQLIRTAISQATDDVTITLDDSEALPAGGGLVTFQCNVDAQRADGSTDAVLDWRLVGAMA